MINLIRNNPFIYEKLRGLYRTLRPPEVEGKLNSLLKGKDTGFFLQVGSNDGLQGDPLRNFILKNKRWQGIFVEPVPFIFERLKKNYRNSERFIFENVAISDTKGTFSFYHISEKAKQEWGGELPIWYDQMGSFDKEHLLKHFVTDEFRPLRSYVVERKVETTTVHDLLERNGMSRLDLLHIDTEGFDYKVLSQVNFSKCKPSVILYEHLHLSKEEKRAGESLLSENGYQFITYDVDTLAWLPQNS
ncbi:MAG: FkbM family methyltransferase [Cyanobacteria bacterium P01_F01_bin.150]